MISHIPKSILAGIGILSLVSVALFAEVLRLRKSALYAGPVPNVYISDVIYIDDPVRGGESASITDIPKASPRVLWAIHIEPHTENDKYRVEIVDAEGARRWAADSFVLMEGSYLTLEMPRDYLEPGVYEVSVWGGDEFDYHLLSEARVQVR